MPTRDKTSWTLPLRPSHEKLRSFCWAEPGYAGRVHLGAHVYAWVHLGAVNANLSSQADLPNLKNLDFR